MNNIKAYKTVYISLGIALITVCGWISIPSSPPVTLQTLAIFVISGVYGTRCAFLCVLCHILLGFAGLPVFSGFRNLTSVLLSPWGGYVVGFILIPPVVGACVKKHGIRTIPLSISILIATVLCYVCATVWLSVFAGNHTLSISALTIPFIPYDLCKGIAAVYLVRRLRPMLGNKFD